MAIAEEGLRNNYGANIGSVLLKMAGENPDDAPRTRYGSSRQRCPHERLRNAGCNLLRQRQSGMTTSIPVIVYAQELKVSEEKLTVLLHLQTS